jgi:NADH-quinone oxidoreductase subunit E
MALSLEARERLTADAARIIARYPQPRSALLPLLHLVQSEEGYVSPDGIALCADLLDLTTAEVSAVATFYTQYKRHPNGKYTVGVCTNTLCAIMGGDVIFDALEEHLGVGHDETTEDGKVTLERVECNAACDYAPVVMVNWEFFDNQTPASARDIVDRLRQGREVAPTRGANSVATFKEVSRVLAGFNDGRAGEGVGAGTPTQRGTVLAQQMGWTAPTPEDTRIAPGRPPGGGGTAAKPAAAAGNGKGAASGKNAKNAKNAEEAKDEGRKATAAAGEDAKARAARTSGTDPAAPAGDADRAGAPAGKPPAETTAGEGDPGGGAAPKSAPGGSTDGSTDSSTGKED